MQRRTFLTSTAIAASAFAGASALAQPRPLTIFVPYPPGGTTDMTARAIGESITERTGLPVVVDNRPGGGGQIAYSAMRQVGADVPVMLVGDYATFGSNAFLYKKFNHDPLTDLQALTTTVAFPMVLYVPKSHPANSVRELVALSKTKPQTYASQGNGSGGHLVGEMFRGATGADLSHVPYRGSAPAVQDAMAAQVDILFDGVAAGAQHVKAGRLKALMVAGPDRAALLPGVPTSVELGLPDVQMTAWFAAATRAEAPPALVQKLHEYVAHAFQTPRIATRFQELGYDTMVMAPAQFGAFMKKESARWAKVIKTYQIAVD
jgi:tripartite-type tricarboxylate transporter receptor subunit TctC